MIRTEVEGEITDEYLTKIIDQQTGDPDTEHLKNWIAGAFGRRPPGVLTEFGYTAEDPRKQTSLMEAVFQIAGESLSDAESEYAEWFANKAGPDPPTGSDLASEPQAATISAEQMRKELAGAGWVECPACKQMFDREIEQAVEGDDGEVFCSITCLNENYT